MKLFNIGNKKADKKEYTWLFYSREGEVLLNSKTFCLPLKEQIIIEKSSEFFNDPDPCYIHRSAVTNRLYFELEKTAQKLLPEEKVAIDALPGDIFVYLELPENAEFLLLS